MNAAVLDFLDLEAAASDGHTADDEENETDGASSILFLIFYTNLNYME